MLMFCLALEVLILMVFQKIFESKRLSCSEISKSNLIRVFWQAIVNVQDWHLRFFNIVQLHRD